MNELEVYVSNITSVEKVDCEWGGYYKLTADTNCYGDQSEQRQFAVSEADYKNILEKGYYMA